ncbi:hypothetical protein RHABOEDO_000199 [Candidatus Rhabdochlamydia oedothoracis]|uniref:Fungal lipase-like domain-containing protein n=1 Tax=Candidatus Rhabdochlamydia oedothoracis TaxID=2720720 RepID=A0ABX8V4F7_9BACT|nr:MULTISPECIES: hypothetical protein [Rhabdochlamydia]KAG6559951.1 hypothetical protein RHOW815_000032 [Candidatus Rhabdochlamydia sp. W815]QYF48099.1 hypothetical protein RHABOEDO_000199 [Candidatus Rhabdochlamydia oedothoracis]
MSNVRTWSLSKLDSLLGTCFPYQRCSYETQEEIKTYRSPLSLQKFAKEHGYFSHAPLLSFVSSSQGDLKVVQGALENTVEVDNNWLDFCVTELLCKALAYRDIALSHEIKIPVRNLQNQIFLETFVLDRIFNLWQQMPAFGWIPKNSHISSLLIFRGTDCSLTTKRSLASLFSDLDFSGPGFSVFRKAKLQIQEWLAQVHQKKKTARVLGCSLGGALAGHTFIEYYDLLSKESSVAFHPPGVFKQEKKNWNQLEKEIKQRFITYVAQGDSVSKVGSLIGNRYVLSIDAELKPLVAHTLLFAGQPLLICQNAREL